MNERSRQLRKRETKLGESLMVAKTCHSGELLSTWIAAPFFGLNKAAACTWIGIGAQRGLGRLFKGASRAEQGVREGLRARPVRFGGVWCGHEVEDGPNRWTPPVCDSGARDLLVSGCSGEGRRAAAGLLSSGPRNSWAVREKEKKGKEGSRPRGVGGGR